MLSSRSLLMASRTSRSRTATAAVTKTASNQSALGSKRFAGDVPVPNSMKARLWEGHPQVEEGWEKTIYFYYGVSFVSIVAIITFSPDTSIEAWAQKEAKARLYLKEKEGFTDFEFGKHYQDELMKDESKRWDKFTRNAIVAGEFNDFLDDDDEEEDEDEELNEDVLEKAREYIQEVKDNNDASNKAWAKKEAKARQHLKKAKEGGVFNDEAQRWDKFNRNAIVAGEFNDFLDDEEEDEDEELNEEVLEKAREYIQEVEEKGDNTSNKAWAEKEAKARQYLKNAKESEKEKNSDKEKDLKNEKDSKNEKEGFAFKDEAQRWDKFNRNAIVAGEFNDFLDDEDEGEDEDEELNEEVLEKAREYIQEVKEKDNGDHN